ncbi:hypothetical protein [Henriciella sp.]|uniref:hypothetical protein n=1 Tax=Henriciella sp. TaxID=1968823 RepID=UPI00261B665E|nr:hypothetical protein [Henriciella sp.]
MSNRLAITLLIYGMAAFVIYGIGMIAVLATPLQAYAEYAIPAVFALSALLAIPIAWKVAPITRSRHQRKLVREDKLGAPYPES